VWFADQRLKSYGMCVNRVKIELQRQHVLLFMFLAFYGLMLAIDSLLCPLTVAVSTEKMCLCSFLGRIVALDRQTRHGLSLNEREAIDLSVFLRIFLRHALNRAIKMRENKNDAFIAITSRRSFFICRWSRARPSRDHSSPWRSLSHAIAPRRICILDD